MNFIFYSINKFTILLIVHFVICLLDFVVLAILKNDVSKLFTPDWVIGVIIFRTGNFYQRRIKNRAYS